MAQRCATFVNSFGSTEVNSEVLAGGEKKVELNNFLQRKDSHIGTEIVEANLPLILFITLPLSAENVCFDALKVCCNTATDRQIKEKKMNVTYNYMGENIQTKIDFEA